jgi:Carboxypeptidase regulatory-like domain
VTDHNDPSRPATSSVARARAVLTGRVRGALRPLPDVMLTLTDRVGAQVARERTGADGEFRLAGIRPGNYVAIFSRTGYRPHAEVVVLNADRVAPLDVTLEATTCVRGVVRDRQSGEPIAAAAVTAVDPDGEVIASTVSDPDGSYRVTGIDAGEITLVVATPGAAPVATAVRLHADGAGPEHDLDLTVDLHSTLTGTVTALGHPVTRLTLTLRDDQGHTVGSTVTDENGTYRFEQIAPGRYTLHSVTRLPKVTTIAPATTTADVVLPPV